MKYNSDGSIKKYKVRFVAKRFFQVYKIDYIEIFASTIRMQVIKNIPSYCSNIKDDF